MRKLAPTAVALVGLVAGGCVHHPHHDYRYYQDRYYEHRHDSRYDHGRYDRHATAGPGYRYGDHSPQRERYRYGRAYGDYWY